MIHIFFALGQNHVNNFEALLINKVVIGGEYVLITGSGTTFNSKLWTRTIISKVSFNNNAISMYRQLQTMHIKVKEYSRIVKDLDSYRNQPCVIYLAYIEDVLSNYLFFNFNKKAKLIIVEDGTLNYYNHTMANIDGLKFKLKKIIAFMHGLRFQEYEGHSSGAAYSKVVAQYLTFPEEAYVSKNAKQLPIIKETIETPAAELYIIGQEAFGAVMGNEYFLKELENYFSELRKRKFYNTISKIYYKPHRNGIRLSEKYIASFFPEKEFVYLNTTKTSEEVYFEEIQCAYISSFNSSTLINIYSKLRNEDRYLFNFYVYPLREDELSPLFKKLNFIFLN